jgi:ankyrin repeat protein
MKTRLVLAVLSASIHLFAAEPVVCQSIDEAIARGNTKAVVDFLKTNPSLAHGGSNPRMTPLQQAILRNNAEIAEILITSGADVNSTDSKNRTPLHLAVERRNPAIVTILLSRQADPSRRDTIGWTPLHHAAAKDATAVARLARRRSRSEGPQRLRRDPAP